MTTQTLTDSVDETGPAISALAPGGTTKDIAVAGQWSLIWAKFTRNKVAVFAGCIILFLYFVGIFAEFLAPALPDASKPQFTYAQPQTIGSAVASDAFFPFADGLLAAVEAGATAVIQPGGSIRDDEVIAAADEAGLAMVFTGMRHFRH